MTAAAAAEKKKKQDEMYYKFYTSRGMGAIQNRLMHYDKAVTLYSSAIENAEPGKEIPLIIARSKAQTRLVNHDAAREDALAAIEKAPDLIQTLENDAFTLYEKDDFEDALVRNYRGLRKRKKPDYFYRGILVGKETIEDCVGRNAGPCLDQTIIEMQMSARKKVDSDSNSLAVAKRKYEKDQIDRFLAQKYLGRQAADKQFLNELLELPHLKFGNKEHNKQLELLLSEIIHKINRNQETLMTQRPMYMLKYQKPTFSKKFEEMKSKEEEQWRNGTMKIINRLLNNADTLRKDRDLDGCLSMCERLRRFVEFQPQNLLSEKERNKILNKLYITIGTLLMDTMTSIPTWSESDNERRIEYILHSNIDDTSFLDRVKKTCFPKIVHVKDVKRDLESRLSLSTNRMERIFLSHEISRCLLQTGHHEEAHKVASAACKSAKSDNNTLWAFNSGFLSSLTELMEGGVDDAKIGLTEVMIKARKLGRDDCSSFIQKVIKIVMEPGRLNFDSPDPLRQREKTILSMMPTPELKLRANEILQKVTNAPQHSKLQLRPTTKIKIIAQRNSRRSMKALSYTKLCSFSEVKMNRPDINQTLKRCSEYDD